MKKSVATADPCVSKSTLTEARALYLRGIEAIDERRSQLQVELDKLTKDRLATHGAVQALDKLIEDVTPDTTPKQ